MMLQKIRLSEKKEKSNNQRLYTVCFWLCNIFFSDKFLDMEVENSGCQRAEIEEVVGILVLMDLFCYLDCGGGYLHMNPHMWSMLTEVNTHRSG